MPRANRHFLPGHVWRITHRCSSEGAFLLEFARDPRRYLRWLFEAKKRFGLSMLDHVATSNHTVLRLRRDIYLFCDTHVGIQRRVKSLTRLAKYPLFSSGRRFPPGVQFKTCIGIAFDILPMYVKQDFPIGKPKE
jgi:hypothetical protein